MYRCLVAEDLHLHSINIDTERFHRSSFVTNLYRSMFISLGLAVHQHGNLSARCILYGSRMEKASVDRPLLRLLYILIGCGLLLLGLIFVSMIHDRYRTTSNAILEYVSHVDNHRSSPSRKASINKHRISDEKRRPLTFIRSGSMVDERSSSVHSFFARPK
jgi:hypothetical protein